VENENSDYMVTDETPFVERFCNTENEGNALLIIAVEENKNVWAKDKRDLESKWSDWYLLGNSADYESNQHFAFLNGAPVKIASGTDQ